MLLPHHVSRRNNLQKLYVEIPQKLCHMINHAFAQRNQVTTNTRLNNELVIIRITETTNNKIE